MNSPTRRFMLLAPLALSVLCGLMIWSLQLGSVALSWRQTMAALGLSSAPLSGMLDTIVVQLRVPRALLAALRSVIWRFWEVASAASSALSAAQAEVISASVAVAARPRSPSNTDL